MRRLVILPLVLLVALPGFATAQEEPESIPVRREVVEWLLDMGKLWQRAHTDDRLVIARKLWSSRDQHDQEIQIACRALAERLEGRELGELYDMLGAPAGEGQRDPFAPSKDPAADRIPTLLKRAERGTLLEQTRSYVRFLRALAAQEQDLPAAIERLAERYPQHPWLAANLDALKRWDAFAAARRELEREQLLPATPPDASERVLVVTGRFEQRAGTTPSPLAVAGWLIADDDDAVQVFTDHLRLETFELGLAVVAPELERHAGGPLPRLEDLDPEAAAYQRLGAGVRTYAGHDERLEAGALTYGQETLLEALYLWESGRRGLAVRLFEVAEACHDRDDDRATGDSLRAGLAAALRARAR